MSPRKHSAKYKHWAERLFADYRRWAKYCHSAKSTGGTRQRYDTRQTVPHAPHMQRPFAVPLAVRLFAECQSLTLGKQMLCREFPGDTRQRGHVTRTCTTTVGWPGLAVSRLPSAATDTRQSIFCRMSFSSTKQTIIFFSFAFQTFFFSPHTILSTPC